MRGLVAGVVLAVMACAPPAAPITATALPALSPTAPGPRETSPTAAAASPAPVHTTVPPATPTAAPALPRPTTVPLRIVDAHNHWPVDVSASRVIASLEEAGVSRVVMMQNGRNHQPPLSLAQQHPDRVIPLLVLHYGFEEGTSSAPTVEVAADSDWVLDLLCLATKHNVVLLVHMESTATTVPALERALTRYPRAKVVWAHQTPLKTFEGDRPEHARKADPAQLDALMTKFPNLYADISVGYETLFYDAAVDAVIPSAWRVLYEKHSDRFAIGADRPFPPGWEPGRYAARIRQQRAWLEQLSPAAQARFAHENIERLLAARSAAGQTCPFQTK